MGAPHVDWKMIRHLLTPQQIEELSKPSHRIPDKLPTTRGAKTVSLQLPRYGRPGPWEITIMKWHPTGLNKLICSHWTTARKLKLADQRRLYAELLCARVPRAENVKRRLTMTLIYRGDVSQVDDDNAWKSIKDGLTHIGGWVDDNPRWSETAPLQRDTAKTYRATILRLEDIPS
jgi:hypothetical protein